MPQMGVQLRPEHPKYTRNKDHPIEGAGPESVLGSLGRSVMICEHTR
jgi:hypothetical protein